MATGTITIRANQWYRVGQVGQSGIIWIKDLPGEISVRFTVQIDHSVSESASTVAKTSTNLTRAKAIRIEGEGLDKGVEQSADSSSDAIYATLFPKSSNDVEDGTEAKYSNYSLVLNYDLN